MKNIHKHLEFRLTEEENKNINYLDLSIHRGNNNLQLGIYIKPLQTDATLHFTSKCPLEQKLATYQFDINNAIYTFHRTSKTARMGHYLCHFFLLALQPIVGLYFAAL